jgi:AcrR family transcriptional regulator
VEEPRVTEDVSERLIAAGLRILGERGAAELTVRRIAEAAGSSTMAVYSRFGGRAGVLSAVYRRGFELLRARLQDAPEPADVAERIIELGLAYRRFALAGPALYAFMFERPLPDFEPAIDLRRDALGSAFPILFAAVEQAAAHGELPARDPVRTAYLLWCTMHGLVSIELTHAVRSPMPGWILGSPQAYEQVLRDGLRAALAGLKARAAESTED